MHAGHDESNVGEAELVVTTSAAPADNPELAEARRRGLPVIKRAEMVARLMKGKYAVAVAGSHGKTTTTGLIAYMLERSGRKPTYLVGGELVDLGTNAAGGDEFDAAFLSYTPHLAVVTNVEPDHLDYYGSFQGLVEAFGRFLARVPLNGVVIAGTDSQAVRGLLKGAGIQAKTIETFALYTPADWMADEPRPLKKGGYTFGVLGDGVRVGRFRTPLPGLYNVANALAAIAAGDALGLPLETVRESVASYRGIRRRFELVGEAAGVTVMDDYAHHPTEVEATLAAARERFGRRRLVCLFQPHTYSRTRYLLEGFRTCFAGADILYILDTYAAREAPEAGMSAQELTRAIKEPPARYVASFGEAAEAALGELRPGDVFFTMGAGDVNEVAPLVLEGLRGGTRNVERGRRHSHGSLVPRSEGPRD